jgi:hypothetical protein
MNDPTDAGASPADGALNGAVEVGSAVEHAAAPVPWARSTGTQPGVNRPRLIVTVALVVALGAIVVIVLGEGRFRQGSPTPLDPSVDGAGLVVGTETLAPFPDGVLPWLVAVVALALGWHVARGRRIARVVASIVAIALAAAVVGALTTTPLSVDMADRTWGDGLGHTSGPTDGALRLSTYQIGTGEPATFGFALDNTGALPVSILGYAEEPIVDGFQLVDLGARIVGLGSIPETPATPNVNDAVVAWPLRVGPGERVFLTVVVRGGPCALGGDAETQGEDATLIHDVRVVYRVAGWTRVATVQLPIVVTVPTLGETCPGPVTPQAS